MFIVSLSYTKSLDEVDFFFQAHLDWLQEQFDRGVFVAAGRKVPRTGGVILARGVGRDELKTIMERDPFTTGEVAEYTIVEFTPTRTLPEFASLIE